MGTGSKIDKLYANGGGSKLDQLYSSGGGDAATKAATRERKSNDMIDRNLQRAMRNGTPQQRVAAGAAYQERSSRPGYQQGGGINSAGSNQERDQKTGEKFTAEGLRLEGKENPADVVAGQAEAANKPASASMGDGSGRDAANARGSIAEGSTGGEWVNVGPSATEDATTPPEANGGAGNGTPAASDWRQKRADALDALKGDFTKQDAANALAKETEPKGIDPKYQPSKETLDMESKFDAMIADRPADQKAFFANMPEKDKAAMVQKNESLKTVREELEKLGPDKNSNAEQAKALIPGAKKEVGDIVNAVDAARKNFMDPMGDSDFRVNAMREKRGALEERASTEIGDRLQAEVIPDNVKAARESLSWMDGGGWNLVKGQEMLGQQANVNKPSPTKEVVPETGGPSPEKQINSPSSIGGKYSGKEYNTSGVFGESRVGEEHFLKTMFKGANTPPAKVNGSGFPSKEKRTPTQASNDMKLQQREASYRAPIEQVLGRNEFLKRFSLEDPVPT